MHVCLYQRIDLLRSEVVAQGSSFRRRKTQEELCVGVHAVLNHIDPGIKSEGAGTVYIVPCRAAGSIVELNPDEVEH